MAIIKCPECGKEISDQAEKCPECGYPIKKQLNSKQLNVKTNKKMVPIITGAIICLVVIVGVLFYVNKNITLSDEEKTLISSVNELQNSLNISSSISIDEAMTAYYDPEYENLKDDTESESSDIFSREMIICILKYSGVYSAYVYDMDGNIMFSSDSDNGFDDYFYDEVKSNFEDQPNDMKVFTKDEITSLVKKTANKNIKVKHNLKKHSDKDKEELLNRKFDEAAQDGDVDYMKKCINDYAMNDSQKEDFQSKLYKYYYDKGCEMIDSGDYVEARGYFTLSNNYEDAETQIKRSYYEEAQKNQSHYSPDVLIELYQKADDYSDAKDEIERVKSYKVYKQNLAKLQSKDVTLDDLKELRSFFEQYKDYANCQEICDYIDSMKTSPYLGTWELTEKSSENLYDVKQYLNITPYWSGDNDHFRFTFSDSKDEFEPRDYSTDIKKISTDDDSEIIPNDDGTLTIKTLSSGFSFGKGMVASSHEYTFKKIEE